MAQHNGPRTCVIIGRLALFALLLSLNTLAPARADIVRAEDHDSFWLWAGVEPQAALSKAKEIYLLAGEVAERGGPRVISQRSATPHIEGPDIWIVYRAQTINWNEPVISEVLKHVEQWRQAGNKVIGLQIDFDSGTRNLERYAAFLTMLRQRLPKAYRLSITGLLDWSANGNKEGLDALAGVVDEVILQIYQGRHVIPGYEAYLKRLQRVKMPFRIGLLQGGDWQPPPDSVANSYFKGYVVFLLNGR